MAKWSCSAKGRLSPMRAMSLLAQVAWLYPASPGLINNPKPIISRSRPRRWQSKQTSQLLASRNPLQEVHVRTQSDVVGVLNEVASFTIIPGRMQSSKSSLPTPKAEECRILIARVRQRSEPCALKPFSRRPLWKVSKPLLIPQGQSWAQRRIHLAGVDTKAAGQKASCKASSSSVHCCRSSSCLVKPKPTGPATERASCR